GTAPPARRRAGSRRWPGGTRALPGRQFPPGPFSRCPSMGSEQPSQFTVTKGIAVSPRISQVQFQGSNQILYANGDQELTQSRKGAELAGNLSGNALPSFSTLRLCVFASLREVLSGGAGESGNSCDTPAFSP